MSGTVSAVDERRRDEAGRRFAGGRLLRRGDAPETSLVENQLSVSRGAEAVLLPAVLDDDFSLARSDRFKRDNGKIVGRNVGCRGGRHRGLGLVVR